MRWTSWKLSLRASTYFSFLQTNLVLMQLPHYHEKNIYHSKCDHTTYNKITFRHMNTRCCSDAAEIFTESVSFLFVTASSRRSLLVQELEDAADSQGDGSEVFNLEDFNEQIRLPSSVPVVRRSSLTTDDRTAFYAWNYMKIRVIG